MARENRWACCHSLRHQRMKGICLSTRHSWWAIPGRRRQFPTLNDISKGRVTDIENNITCWFSPPCRVHPMTIVGWNINFSSLSPLSDATRGGHTWLGICGRKIHDWPGLGVGEDVAISRGNVQSHVMFVWWVLSDGTRRRTGCGFILNGDGCMKGSSIDTYCMWM